LIGVVVVNPVGSLDGGCVAPGETFPAGELMEVGVGDPVLVPVSPGAFDVHATAATTRAAEDLRTRGNDVTMGRKPAYRIGEVPSRHPHGGEQRGGPALRAMPHPPWVAIPRTVSDDAAPMRPLVRSSAPVSRGRPPFAGGLAVLVAASVFATLPASAAPAEVQLTAPTAGASLRGTVPLRATAPGADAVTFQMSRVATGPYRAIGADSTSGDGWKASWNTRSVADGTRFLRVRADGPDGRAFSSPVRIDVDNTAPEVTITASSPAFSPNGDGVKDRASVSVRLSEPAALELDVVNAAGRLVHRMQAAHHLSAGPHRFDWAGLVLKEGHWRTVQDGPLALRATAVDDAGNIGKDVGAIRVDTVAPGFHWKGVNPEPASGAAPVTLSFEAFDPGDALSISAAIWNDVKRVAFAGGITRAPGDATVAISPPSSPTPGLYRARLDLVDRAGNQAQSPFLAFRIQHPVTTTVVRGFTGVGNRIALTFDDCAFGDAWDDILDALEARGLRATFFCASSTLDGNAAQARRTIADGMSIGSHTRNHPVLTGLSAGEIRSQLQADIDAWWRIAHATPLPLFRPPYGAYDGEVLQVAGSLGFRWTTTWDVDPEDWSNIGVSEIRQRVLSHAHAGAVVVMHVKPNTAAALPGLLDALKARGYRQTALDEMLRVAGGTTGLRVGPPSWNAHRAG
jgi:peptidoglycan/xylan/chitin deacetylase (PgdA/CDA1 family)